MSEIIFLRCDGNNKDFIENCRLLDEDLDLRVVKVKIRPDTILKNFPLFCPKCKPESLINAEKLNLIRTAH